MLICAVIWPAASRAQSTPPDQVVFDMLDAISTDSLLRHIQVLEDAGGTRSRVSFTPGKDSAAVYIKQVFDRMPGLTAVYYDTFYVQGAQNPYRNQPQVNVVGVLEGRLDPGRYYVIGGHYDSTADRDDAWDYGNTRGANWKTTEAPGANDNATGVASVLELARVLSDPKTGFRPDYTLVFIAFGVEERIPHVIGTGSHIGSAHYANTAKSRGEEISGMISIDMVGFNNNHHYSALAIHDNFMVDQSVQFATKLYQANTDFDIGLIMNSPPFARGSWSDHDSFANQGYPAVVIIENAPPWRSNQFYTANPYYHKTTDTWEKINMQLVHKVTQLNLATIASLGGGLETSVEAEPLSPEKIALLTNYPNPFNPSTNIVFELNQAAHVTLSVHDITGRNITVLIDETVSSGRHSVSFDAGAGGLSLPSGIYFYRIVSGTDSAAGKMLLVR